LLHKKEYNHFSPRSKPTSAIGAKGFPAGAAAKQGGHCNFPLAGAKVPPWATVFECNRYPVQPKAAKPVAAKR